MAFKVAQLLLAEVPEGPEQALRPADHAAIGSIADVVPIVGENRSIVRLGLARLDRASARLGGAHGRARIDRDGVSTEASRRPAARHQRHGPDR